LTSTKPSDPGFYGKRLEFLKEAIPALSRVAFLSDAESGWAPEAAARALRVTLLPILVKSPDGLPPALASIERQRVDAMYVNYDR